MSNSFKNNISEKKAEYIVEDINGKKYDSSINNIKYDDNINTVLEKIAYYCNKETTKYEVFIWYIDNKDQFRSLFIYYTENITLKNPLDDIPDTNFINVKKYDNRCINNIDDIKDNKIYYITIKQFLDA